MMMNRIVLETLSEVEDHAYYGMTLVSGVYDSDHARQRIIAPIW